MNDEIIFLLGSLAVIALFLFTIGAIIIMIENKKLHKTRLKRKW